MGQLIAIGNGCGSTSPDIAAAQPTPETSHDVVDQSAHSPREAAAAADSASSPPVASVRHVANDPAPESPDISGSVDGPSDRSSGGTVVNAGSVVAGMSAGFRRCYNRGLRDDPKMTGSLRFKATIGPDR